MISLAFVMWSATSSAALGAALVHIDAADTSVIVDASGARSLSIEADGDVRHEVTTGRPTRIRAWGEGTIVVHLPHGVGLELSSRSGDVQVAGEFSQLRVQTVSGDIDLHATAQQIKIATVSGDVAFRGRAERLELTSISGDLSVEGTSGELRAQTTSGELSWNGDWPKRFDFRTVSGDVEMSGLLVADASIHLRSTSGDLLLNPLGAVGYRLEARTHSGQVVAGGLHGDRVDTLVRGGGASIDARTFSGDVVMVR